MQSTADPSSSMDNIKTINLHVPDPDELKKVLECGLKKKNFTEITLEWIDHNTNLTKEPFNLAAPRICGNTAVLDIGDLSYWQPNQDATKVYNIEKLLKSLNYDQKNFFMFGNGFAYRTVFHGHCQEEILSELVMNQSFRPAVNRVVSDVNKNRFTYMSTSRCNIEMFENPDTVPLCYMKGTFFLCDGIASKVLKIHAKLNDPIYKSPFDFINSMQDALYEKHGKNGENIVLGGIYKVESALLYGWKHVSTPNNWRSFLGRPRNCFVKVPEAIISIFNSSTITPSPHCPGFKASQSTHCLSHQYANNLHEFHEHDVVEFTGYFSLAQKLFRVDEPITQTAE